MMKWIFTGLIFLSIVFGAINNNMQEVSNSAILECTKAVELAITLCGSICLWNGLMRVASKAGLTKIIANILSPITNVVFKGLDKGSYALELISMNITANLLGLGNAATPLGISAIQELNKNVPENQKGTASNHMIMLVVMNTASIQLIPTTIATLRLAEGSTSPMDILPAVWISSLVSVSAALLVASILNKIFPACKRKDL